MAESTQHHDDDEHDLASAIAVGGDPGGSSFWTTYTEPSHLQGVGHDGEEGHMGMSSVDLGLLVSATAAMGGAEVGTDEDMNGMGQQEKKRGRGRPKGVKNGTGRAAMEKKRQQLQLQNQQVQQVQQTQHQQQHQQHQQHQHQHQQEQQRGQDNGQHAAEQNLAATAWGANIGFADDHNGWGPF